MKKQKKLVIAFLIALLSLIVLYLAVVLPLVNREEPKPDGIQVDEGEDVLVTIDDDDEFNKVATIFEENLSELFELNIED